MGAVAVVTGGGSGLGAAMARVWAGEGMRVAALDIDAAAAARTADELRAEGVDARSTGVDVADRAALDAAAARVRDELGTCNVLCANVGVQQFGALEALTAEDWQWVLAVNVVGTVNTVNAFLPLLRAAEGPRHIVITASVAALAPSPRQGAYIVSKYAVTGYADVLRTELADEDIAVTTLFPSGMMTNHLGSSAAARPEALGPSLMRDEDLEVIIATAGTGDDELTDADDAVTRLVDEVRAGESYSFTHGRRGDEISARHRALEEAYDRMRTARDTRDRR